MIKTIIAGSILALILFLNWNELPMPVRNGITGVWDFSKKFVTENKEAPAVMKDKANKAKKKWKKLNKMVNENY